MGLDALLSKLEKRQSDTPDTPCNQLGYQPQPPRHKACTPDTLDTPKIIKNHNETTKPKPLPQQLGKLGDRKQIRAATLESNRAAYFEHMGICPTCSAGGDGAARCGKHAELWQAYESALVGVHGAERVIGVAQPQTASPSKPHPPCNGYQVVPTAQVRPPAWHNARDAYYSHLMACEVCKPSGLCNEGRQLRQEYNIVSAVPVLAK